MIVDKATCLYCDGEFHVTEYGYRVPCPLCGKRLDIFPEDKYYIDTPFGVIGIGTTESSFFLGPMLRGLIKMAAGKVGLAK